MRVGQVGGEALWSRGSPWVPPGMADSAHSPHLPPSWSGFGSWSDAKAEALQQKVEMVISVATLGRLGRETRRWKGLDEGVTLPPAPCQTEVLRVRYSGLSA